jgi:ubiquinone/menaquinone biosynthesis C-methylase UbiE
MNKSRDFWNQQHVKYVATDWINKPTIFATQIEKYFPKTGSFLELGAGQGQDSRYFAVNGLTITSTDFSGESLKFSKQKTPDYLKGQIKFQALDLSRNFSFTDSTFDIVYSHLAIHYFDHNTTEQIFSEIYRVLKPGGVLALLVNSTNDPEFGTGKRLEDQFFQFENETTKRYFSLDSMRKFTKQFKPLLIDTKGETYKDRAIGVTNLIRFVGKKV